MVRVNAFLILSLALTLLYCLGLLLFLIDTGEDVCDMTYMFEYPQYVRVSNRLDRKFPKYGLYAYSEGRFTSRIRNMEFDGIPVLFVPGNAGSHKQVRSLASVALRKAISAEVPFHFDYFTIDLNHELSGMHGPLLYEQLEYVNASFHKIFELYKSSKRPSSVVVVGHSMGGIVARNLLARLPNPKLISILITMAAPLRRPVIITDYYMEKFYESSVHAEFLTTFVSLSGGYRDLLVPSFLSKPSNNDSVYAVTPMIPRAWTGCDHVQILWCKQVILVVTRALFDAVDLNTLQISSNASYRNSVFNHHLVTHSGIKIRESDSYSKPVEINYKGKWIEQLTKQYSIKHLKGLPEAHWYMVRMTTLPGYQILNVLAINLGTVDWVYACNAHLPVGASRVCSEAMPLTHLSQMVPSNRHKRRFVQIDVSKLRKKHSELTHVVFRALPTREPVVFHVDIHSEVEREIIVDMAKWWSIKKHVIIEETNEHAVYYKLILSQLYHVAQFYHLFLEPVSCSKENHHATAVLVSPWSNEKSNAYFTATKRRPMEVRLFNSKPLNDPQSAYIQLILDPACRYRVSMKSSQLGILAQMARLYSPSVPAYMAVILLMALRYQMSKLPRGRFPLIFYAIKNGVKPYYIITAIRISSQFLKGKLPHWMPFPDNWYLIENGIDFLLLPLLLYMSTVGIVWMFSIVYIISLFTLENTVNKLFLKLFGRTFVWSNYLTSCFQKFPVVFATLLVVLSVTTCGSLSLCLGATFYFLKLTQMSQDYVEEIVWQFIKDLGRKIKKKFFGRSRNATRRSRRRRNERPPENDSVEHVNNHGTDRGAEPNLEIIDDELLDQIMGAIQDPPIHGHSHAHGHVHVHDGEDHDHDEADEIELIIDDPETNEIEAIEAVPAKFNPIFFHSTMFFLWVLIAALNVSTVLTWARNFKYNKTISPDVSFVPGVTLSICALPLWQFEFPKTDRRWGDKLEVVIIAASVLSLMFATITWYRLSYILTAVFALIVAHQLFAPKIEGTQDDGDDDKGDDGKDKIDAMKAKLD